MNTNDISERYNVIFNFLRWAKQSINNNIW